MGNFQIPSIPPTTNKTVRFPNDVVEAVEQATQRKNCTFSAFVIAAVRAALEDLIRILDSKVSSRIPCAAHTYIVLAIKKDLTLLCDSSIK